MKMSVQQRHTLDKFRRMGYPPATCEPEGDVLLATMPGQWRNLALDINPDGTYHARPRLDLCVACGSVVPKEALDFVDYA